MTLVVLSVVVIALFIAVLAIHLFTIGGLLKHVADNLDDCLTSVQQISRQAGVIGPGVMRLNETGGKLVGAMPLLYGGAETLVAKLAPAAAPPAAAAARVGYMDEPGYAEKPSSVVVHAEAVPVGVGYLDK